MLGIVNTDLDSLGVSLPIIENGAYLIPARGKLESLTSMKPGYEIQPAIANLDGKVLLQLI
jgi:hypothetical protein